MSGLGQRDDYGEEPGQDWSRAESLSQQGTPGAEPLWARIQGSETSLHSPAQVSASKEGVVTAPTTQVDPPGALTQAGQRPCRDANLSLQRGIAASADSSRLQAFAEAISSPEQKDTHVAARHLQNLRNLR